MHIYADIVYIPVDLNNILLDTTELGSKLKHFKYMFTSPDKTGR